MLEFGKYLMKNFVSLIVDAVLCLGNSKKTKLFRQINIPREARNIADPVLLSYEAELVSVLVSS